MESGSMKFQKEGEFSGLEEFKEVLAAPLPGVVLIDINVNNPDSVGSVGKAMQESFLERERPWLPAVAFRFVLSPSDGKSEEDMEEMYPWEHESVSVWCKSFVEKYKDVLGAIVDEHTMRRIGLPMESFPGAGLVRVLVLAGYGETVLCTRCIDEGGECKEESQGRKGKVGMKLNSEGIELALVARVDSCGREELFRAIADHENQAK